MPSNDLQRNPFFRNMALLLKLMPRMQRAKRSPKQLPRFPVDASKLDWAFISNMNTDRDRHEIVRADNHVAHSVRLKSNSRRDRDREPDSRAEAAEL